MLLLSAARTITVDGVTVFPDHADPNQFWYLPGPIALAHRKGGQDDFTFIKFKPAAVQGGAKGGGFVMFTTCLKLDSATEARIKSRLSGVAAGNPNLSLVPFDTGTVKCIALNLQGSGGTTASAARAGGFNAVEEILGATTPSLQGDEEAAFSLTLSQEGATILEQAYKQGTGPIGVVYDLKFTGMRPSLDVKITADYKQIYDGLNASLGGQYYFVKATLEAGFEKLVQQRAIKIEVFNATTDADAKEKEQWALDFFKEKLLTEWFTPTLSPGELKVKLPEDAGLPDPVGKIANAVSGTSGDKTTPKDEATTPDETSAADKTTAKDKTTTPEKTAATGDSATPDKTGSAGEPAASEKAAPTEEATTEEETTTPEVTAATPGKAAGIGVGGGAAVAMAPAPLPAKFEIISRAPDPSPQGYDILCTPSASGLTETIIVTGATDSTTVTVDDVKRPLDASHQFNLEVAPGATHNIAVDFPAGERPSETFELLFQFDLPAAAGFKIQPPSASYKSYLTNSANDQPFRRSHAPTESSSSKGAQALRDWINTLPGSKIVELEATASWEGFEDTAHMQHNLDLSNRRLLVALGIIGDHAEKKLVNFRGDQKAREAGRKSTPGGTADNPDRAVHIKGYTGEAAPEARISARISRPADPAKPTSPVTPPAPHVTPPSSPTPPAKPHTPQATPPSPATPPKHGTPATPGKSSKPDQPGASGSQSMGGSPSVAFKLKFVHQDEQKTMVFEYHRSDAVQRTYAPQGFFGLMLGDLDEDKKHFVEVDLDDPFFREFAVTVQAPINLQKIGLQSAHVSLDYGDPQDAANHKHGDVIFDASRPKEYKFAVFMNANHDTTYTYASEYHFDPDSGWDGRSFAYQLPRRKTEDRNLLINPYDQIGFLEVQVFPHQMDPGVMDSIDVELAHVDAGGKVVGRILNVTPGSQPQFWRVLLDDPQARTYTYQLTHHLRDGTVKQADPVTTRATALPINDPFDRAIEIDFVPLLNAAATRMVFIDLEYDDPKNAYHRQERLVLQGNAQNPVHMRIALMDPKKISYRYRPTFVGTGNQMKQGAFVETAETLISVSDAQ